MGRAALLLAGLWLGALLMTRADPAQSTGGPQGQPTAAAPAVSRPPAPPEERPGPPATPDPDLLMDHVRKLAENIGPRPAGTPQEAQAANYVAGYLKGLGYVTAETDNIALGSTGRVTGNVVAGPPNAAAFGPGLLIGAHLDSFAVGERSPGANDNASGVAVLLETARLCAGTTTACPVYFAAFGGEERQDHEAAHCHYGSRHFYGHQSRPLAAMIAVDMVGVGDRLYLAYLPPAPEPLLQLLERAAARVGIAVARQPNQGASDHEPFAKGGIPAIWLRRGEDPAQHTADDLAERVEPVYLQSAVTLLMQFIRDLTETQVQSLAGWSIGSARCSYASDR